MNHSGAPVAVRDWGSRPPIWVEVDRGAAPVDIGLAFLGPGEREAIQISLLRQADILLIDELRGRLEAERRGLKTIGILGIIFAAGKRNMLDGEIAFHRLLRETNFRISTVLEVQFLDRIRKRR